MEDDRIEDDLAGAAEVRVSAPGKVILFGEHAVVYGKTALAASLKLRSRLLLRELASGVELCEIEMPGVGLSIRLPIEQLQSSLLPLHQQPDEDGVGGSSEEEMAVHALLLERVRAYVRERVVDVLDERQRRSLECLLYALARVARAEGLRQLPGAFLLRLTTDLPLGAGLGSSASFSVCLAAGFLLWARLRRSAPDDSADALDGRALRLQVSRHALGCERIMHGAPSGVDNEVCTFGSVVEFRKGDDLGLIPLAGRLAELRVLLVDTGVARSTKLLVDKLARQYSRFPPVYDAIFESVDRLCRRVVEIIKGPSSEDADLLEACRQLSALIDINQGLLSTCQVSHPAIDSICQTAKSHGLSAKLTGAGGGGFVYVLVPPDMPAAKLHNVTCELTANGFSVIETNLGDSGLEVTAVLRNNNQLDS